MYRKNRRFANQWNGSNLCLFFNTSHLQYDSNVELSKYIQTFLLNDHLYIYMYIFATNIRLISNTIRIQFQKLLSFKTITFTFIYIFEKRVTYVSNTIRISNIELYKNSNYFNYFKMIFICIL